MSAYGLTLIDYVGIVFYATAWFAYHVMNERMAAGRSSLNRLMNGHRYLWIKRLVERDNRIIDANINATLQNGSAFFASTSLIAVGGSLTLLRSTNELLTLFEEMPFGLATNRLGWELKALGLTVIFVYAFFKFAWSYRLFNYGAILIGAIPNPKGTASPEEMDAAAWRAASMNTVAGRHFNRGQRAFFFSLAYLGWFISAYVLVAATAAVLLVMWRRQFASDALAALSKGPWPTTP